MSSKIFVIGLCRSGTSWLGEILRSHPEIYGTHEPSEVIHRLLDMSQDPALVESGFPKVLDFYRKQHSPSNPLHYCDKSHTNIWFVEKLAEAFPGAKFVGIQRDPYGVVASMLAHQHSVDGLFANSQKFPPDNPLLGTARGMNLGEYSRAGWAALRWRSHQARLAVLSERDDVFVLEYGQLLLDTESVLQDLRSFLELTVPFPAPSRKVDSLTKWKGTLGDADRKDIDRVINDKV